MNLPSTRKLILNQPRRPVKAKRIVQKRMAIQITRKLVLNQLRRPVKAKRIVQKRMAMQMSLPQKGEHKLKQQRKTVKVNEAHRRAASS